MILGIYYKPNEMKMIQQLGHDLVIAYKLKEAAKCFGDSKDIKMAEYQFQSFKGILEILSRWNRCCVPIFTKKEQEEFIEKHENYYKFRGQLDE